MQKTDRINKTNHQLISTFCKAKGVLRKNNSFSVKSSTFYAK